MKYNPKRNERLAALPGFAGCTRYQPDEHGPGHAGAAVRDAGDLGEIAGLDAVIAAAGRRRAGRADRRCWSPRRTSATEGRHAAPRCSSPTAPTAPTRRRRTSPASRPSRVKSDARGLVDLDDLRGASSTTTRRVHDHQPEHARPVRAADRRDRRARSTRPGRLGLPRRRQHERHPRHHPAGRLGRRHDALQPPQDLHRPARRRRARRRARSPSAAPRAVPARPRRSCGDGDGVSPRTTTGRKSIGRVRGFFGNVGILLRAYCYIRSQRPRRACEAVTENAVLNANYLLARLKRRYRRARRRPLHARVRAPRPAS